MCFSNDGASALTRPSQTVFISRIRPRGESVSTPRTANVGQLGRHNPQWTHREMSSSDGASAFG